MKTKSLITALVVTSILLSSYTFQNNQLSCQLTVNVKNLRNSKGVVQFALYNQDGSIPDVHFKKYFRKMIGEIKDSTSSITFDNLPPGKYAVNILHDENKNEKIDRGFILPIEGIGFSNYQSIGISNRPNFSKASFDVKENKTISVKVIYM